MDSDEQSSLHRQFQVRYDAAWPSLLRRLLFLETRTQSQMLMSPCRWQYQTDTPGQQATLILEQSEKGVAYGAKNHNRKNMVRVRPRVNYKSHWKVFLGREFSGTVPADVFPVPVFILFLCLRWMYLHFCHWKPHQRESVASRLAESTSKPYFNVQELLYNG